MSLRGVESISATVSGTDRPALGSLTGVQPVSNEQNDADSHNAARTVVITVLRDNPQSLTTPSLFHSCAATSAARAIPAPEPHGPPSSARAVIPRYCGLSQAPFAFVRLDHSLCPVAFTSSAAAVAGSQTPVAENGRPHRSDTRCHPSPRTAAGGTACGRRHPWQ